MRTKEFVDQDSCILDEEKNMQAVAHFIDTFVPEHYELFLDLNRADKTFSGKVTITGEAKSSKISASEGSEN